MNKREEKSWRKTFDGLARHTWVAFPMALIGIMESIMESQVYAPGEKVEMMRWAIEAYNEAVKEAANNGKNLSD